MRYVQLRLGEPTHVVRSANSIFHAASNTLCGVYIPAGVILTTDSASWRKHPCQDCKAELRRKS